MSYRPMNGSRMSRMKPQASRPSRKLVSWKVRARRTAFSRSPSPIALPTSTAAAPAKPKMKVVDSCWRMDAIEFAATGSPDA